MEMTLENITLIILILSVLISFGAMIYRVVRNTIESGDKNSKK